MDKPPASSETKRRLEILRYILGKEKVTLCQDPRSPRSPFLMDVNKLYATYTTNKNTYLVQIPSEEVPYPQTSIDIFSGYACRHAKQFEAIEWVFGPKRLKGDRRAQQYLKKWEEHGAKISKEENIIWPMQKIWKHQRVDDTWVVPVRTSMGKESKNNVYMGGDLDSSQLQQNWLMAMKWTAYYEELSCFLKHTFDRFLWQKMEDKAANSYGLSDGQKSKEFYAIFEMTLRVSKAGIWYSVYPEKSTFIVQEWYSLQDGNMMTLPYIPDRAWISIDMYPLPNTRAEETKLAVSCPTHTDPQGAAVFSATLENLEVERKEFSEKVDLWSRALKLPFLDPHTLDPSAEQNIEIVKRSNNGPRSYAEIAISASTIIQPRAPSQLSPQSQPLTAAQQSTVHSTRLGTSTVPSQITRIQENCSLGRYIPPHKRDTWRKAELK